MNLACMFGVYRFINLTFVDCTFCLLLIQCFWPLALKSVLTLLGAYITKNLGESLLLYSPKISN